MPDSLILILFNPRIDCGIHNRLLRSDFAYRGHVNDCILVFERRDELVRRIETDAITGAQGGWPY